MKVVLYIDQSDKENVAFVTKAIKDTHTDFDWTILSKESVPSDEIESMLGCYIINASSQEDVKSDLKWPRFSVFVKDPKLKTKVWEEINKFVLPAMRTKTVSLDGLNLSSAQLQKILSMITSSESSFSLDLPDGRSIAVSSLPGENTKEVIRLTHSDIASMLGAMWIFNSRTVHVGG